MYIIVKDYPAIPHLEFKDELSDNDGLRSITDELTIVEDCYYKFHCNSTLLVRGNQVSYIRAGTDSDNIIYEEDASGIENPEFITIRIGFRWRTIVQPGVYKLIERKPFEMYYNTWKADLSQYETEVRL